jgi:hypothetical protein
MKIKSALFVIVCTAISFSACKQSSNKLTDAEKGDKISQDSIQQGVEKVVFPLPKPMGVYQMLEDIGATYAGKVLNPVESNTKYLTSNVKAVNLGVYAADLSYATIYDKKADIDAYGQVLKSIIDDMGIKVDYQLITSEENRKKVENSDSLVQLTTKVFYNVYDFLYQQSDPSYAALMANGYYVEGLYIATHLMKETYNNYEMLKIVCQQEAPLAEIIKLNEKFADNQYVQTLQGSLKKLKALYESYGGSINQKQLDELAKTIEAIRSTMVE